MRRSQRKNSNGGYKPHYVPGDWKRICDISGFLVKASETRHQWDGLIARERDWTPRNPQDFVKGTADRQRVSHARPEPTTDKFATLNRFITGKASGGASVKAVGTSS